MKKVGLLLLVLAFVVSAGKAQPGQGRQQSTPEERAKQQTEEIGKAVNFTAGQEAKVNDLNLKYAKKNQELRSGVSFRDMDENARAEMRKKMDALQADKDKEMKSILTEAQYKLYEVYLKERQQRMRDRQQQRPPQ